VEGGIGRSMVTEAKFNFFFPWKGIMNWEKITGQWSGLWRGDSAACFKNHKKQPSPRETRDGVNFISRPTAQKKGKRREKGTRASLKKAKKKKLGPERGGGHS